MTIIKTNLWVLAVVTVLLTPVQSQAETEQLYVSGMDIDYMETNKVAGWIEDVKERLAEASPFLKEVMLAEDHFVSEEGVLEEEIYND